MIPQISVAPIVKSIADKTKYGIIEVSMSIRINNKLMFIPDVRKK
jgi:hypothetical protein